MTIDSAPGTGARTARFSATGQRFEVPTHHEHLRADTLSFATNGIWTTIQGSPCGRAITLTGSNSADNPATLAYTHN